MSQQQELPGMSGPKLLSRSIKNALWCRRFAHSRRLEGKSDQFHTWMKVGMRSVESAKRLSRSGVASLPKLTAKLSRGVAG